MSRTNSTNYTAAGINFPYANAGSDAFHKEDVQTLAAAVEAHDHSSTKGLAVARLATAVTLGGATTLTGGGVTINSGGLTVTAGGATITAGGLTVTAGGLTANALTVTGSVLLNSGVAVGGATPAPASGLLIGGATPTAPAASIGLGVTTSGTATAGGVTIPTAATFWVVNIGGTTYKIPLCSN